MKEKVFVTALSICVILAICPGMLLYANETDQPLSDLFGELNNVQGEVLESTSVQNASEEEEITDESNTDDSNPDIILADQCAFAVEDSKNGRVLIPQDSECPAFDNQSQIALRAPPKAL